MIISGGNNRMQFLYRPARITTTPFATAWRMIRSGASGAPALSSTRSRTNSINIIGPRPRTSPTSGSVAFQPS